jgi:hypothetical protein
MKFIIGTSSVSFEFDYKNYVINVADYVTAHQKIEPVGKVSVMITKHGKSISRESNLLIAAFISNRIQGSAWASDKIIEVSLHERDQFMWALMDGMKLIIG